ncbi:hypothetical protein K5E40_24200 [Pseudomonas baetica]|uniref:hypothetical protein n=1 Tax=Pseudomonas baetica TaxID=674054 RepID=UPI001C8BADFF|nr:hypothetical protein [Pseudomonas baetica]MBX9408779.1 hypothetical protein [Pseudomonas baetica]
MPATIPPLSEVPKVAIHLSGDLDPHTGWIRIHETCTRGCIYRGELSVKNTEIPVGAGLPAIADISRINVECAYAIAGKPAHRGDA